MPAESSRPKILLVYPLLAPEYHAELAELGELVFCPSDEPDEIARRIPDASVVLLRGPAKLTAAHIATAPRLQAIAVFGAGFDNVDVDAATRAGVPVLHSTGASPQSVAEFVLGAMVAGHRRLLDVHQRFIAGRLDWSRRLQDAQGFELEGSTLGVVGYGSIGRNLAQRAIAAFGVEVIVFDPFLDADPDEPWIRRTADLGVLLDASDTVSVHVPATPRTRGLLGAAELDRIGSNGVLVDAARGGIVDEGALVAALTAGRLKAAVLDVFEEEPPTHERIQRLAQAPNLLLTPHVAGVTPRAAQRLSASVVEGVRAVLEGRRPPRVANPVVLDPS